MSLGGECVMVWYNGDDDFQRDDDDQSRRGPAVKPGTELPWEQNRPVLGSKTDVFKGRRLVANCGGFSDSREETRDTNIVNTAYIVHACNAYPRLVEALQQACEAAVPTGTGGIDAPWYVSARALLTELGE